MISKMFITSNVDNSDDNSNLIFEDKQTMKYSFWQNYFICKFPQVKKEKAINASMKMKITIMKYSEESSSFDEVSEHKTI